jgi:tRNA pseudouridine32 synthase/23S rRNA pseudouridine746 synthase
MVSGNKIVLRAAVALSSPMAASAYLCMRTGLSQAKVKDAMNKGALWVRRNNGPMRRLRKASAILISHDWIEFYYDERLLSLVPPDAACIADAGQYSVWFKPAGLLSQGTKFGDHCSLVRRAELFFRPSRGVFPVHRLDREVAGLMLLAHTGEAAARLSELLRHNLIIKKYHVEVLGHIAEKEQSGAIDLPLEGRPSRTCFKVLSLDPQKGTSSLEVTLSTGRLHQIRRHFEMIGFPVMGDPRYGRGNKNAEGMKLRAVSLKFRCPFQGSEREYSLPE